MSDLKVTLVQTELDWEDVEANLNRFDQKLHGVEETDLIVLPEMFTTGFTMNPERVVQSMSGSSIQWMKNKAKIHNAVICGSLVIEESGDYFNRFIIAYPDGRIKHYDKRHLFSLVGEDEHYIGGKERLIVEVNGWKILPQICYDLRFPVFARSRKQAESHWEYDAVIYVANWPKPRIHAWDTLLKARAIENQAYCIGVNRIGYDQNDMEYVGHSAAYDFAGLAVAELNDQEITSTVTLNREPMRTFRERFPFQRDGDEFAIQ